MTRPQTRAQFEELLRGAGFSNRQARRIAAEGFHAEAVEQTASADETAAAQRLLSLLEQSTIEFAGDVRNEYPGTVEQQQTQHPDSLSRSQRTESRQEPADAPDTGTPGKPKTVAVPAAGE